MSLIARRKRSVGEDYFSLLRADFLDANVAEHG